MEFLKFLGALAVVFGAIYLFSAAGNENRPQNTFGFAVMIFAVFIFILVVKVIASLFGL